jgi:NTE family protein
MASAAVPGIFPPREVDGDWLVDGGVTDDYPVDVAEWIGATQVVGIWVDERLDQGLPAKFHLGHVIAVSLAVMIRELSLTRQQVTAIPRIDIRLEIDGGHLVFDRVADIIEHGYQSVWAHRDDIRERQLIPEKG